MEPRIGRALLDKRALIWGPWGFVASKQQRTNAVGDAVARWVEANYATSKASVARAFGFPHIACPRAFWGGIARRPARKSDGVPAFRRARHRAGTPEAPRIIECTVLEAVKTL